MFEGEIRSEYVTNERWLQQRTREKHRREDATMSRVFRRLGMRPAGEVEEALDLDVPAGTPKK